MNKEVENPEPEGTVEEIFEEALNRPPDERAAFLETACRGDEALRSRVEALIASDAQAQAEAFLQTPFPSSATRDVSDPAGDMQVVRKIGRYEVTAVIAAGGMGTVYEAMQENPRRRVALKVIHSNLISKNALRRFVYEAEILARLRHPGIVHVYEVGFYGETFTVPFFAMEYIPGAKAITQYAQDQGLSIRQRLELFGEVCDAVHHGHQHGIIHRDLKPGNILVDQGGRPKIIDFGVARATDADITLTMQQTDAGHLVGTLRYMSPEQYRGSSADIDTRCDVYALGLLLYELLTGRFPYDFSHTTPFEIPRLVREWEPKRLSSWNRSLRGDMEVIVMQAIEKDRDRRYPSVDLLARDIRRFLNHEPIEARRGIRWYLLKKMLWRHRIAATVAAAFVVFLVGFGIAMSILYVRAENEAETARKVQDTLQEILAAADPYESMKSDRPVRDLLDDTAKRIEADVIPQPLVRAAVHYTLGRAYSRLGLYDKAEQHLLPALRIRIAEYGDDHPDVAKVRSRLGELRNAQGRYHEAETLVRAAVKVQRGLPEDARDPLGESLNLHALILKNLGKYDEAEAAAREVLEIERALHGEGHPKVAEALSSLAIILLKKGDYAGSEALMRRLSSIDRRYYGDEHAVVARDMNNMGLLLREMGEYEVAENYHRQALAIQRNVLGEDHPDIAVSLENLGCVRMLRGDLVSAEALFRKTLAMKRKFLGKSHPTEAVCWMNLAMCLDRKGDYTGAEEAQRRALDIGRSALDENHPLLLWIKAQLGKMLYHTGRVDEAEQLMRDALSAQRRVLGQDHVNVLISENDLALVLQDKGELAEAESLLKDALARSRKVLGEDHPNVFIHLNNLGAVQRDKKQYEKSKRNLLEALSLCLRIHGDKSFEKTLVLMNLGRLYLTEHDYDAAKKTFQELLAIRREIFHETTRALLGALYWYANALAEGGEYTDTLPVLKEYLERLEAVDPESPYLPLNRCFLGLCLLRLERTEEAEPLILDGMKALRERFGDEHPYTQKALRYALLLYRSTGRPEKAAALEVLLIDGL